MLYKSSELKFDGYPYFVSNRERGKKVYLRNRDYDAKKKKNCRKLITFYVNGTDCVAALTWVITAGRYLSCC